MTIKRIEIEGLFGQFNYSIPLNIKDHVTVMGGANGSGKTTILKLLKAVLEVDCDVIADIPFRKFRLQASSSEELLVSKEIESLEMPLPQGGHPYLRRHVDYTQVCRSMKIMFSGSTAPPKKIPSRGSGIPVDSTSLDPGLIELRSLTPGSVCDTVLRFLTPNLGRWWVYESGPLRGDINSTDQFMKLDADLHSVLREKLGGFASASRKVGNREFLQARIVNRLRELERQDTELFKKEAEEAVRFFQREFGYSLPSPNLHSITAEPAIELDEEGNELQVQGSWVRSFAISCADKVALIPTTRLSQLSWVDQKPTSPGPSDETILRDIIKKKLEPEELTRLRSAPLKWRFQSPKAESSSDYYWEVLEEIRQGLPRKTQETLAVVRRFSNEIAERCSEAMRAKARSVKNQENLALRFMKHSQEATDVTREDVEKLRGQIKDIADNAAAMGFDPDLIRPEDEELVEKWEAAEDGKGGSKDQAIVRQLMFLTYVDKLDGWTPAQSFIDRAKVILRRMDRFFGGKKELKIDGDRGYYIETETGDRHAVEELSSGELQQLVFTHFLVFFECENGLVLIDEPEISLDVSWQDSYVRDMLEIVRDLTSSESFPLNFILATHSPIIAERAPWEDYVELTHVETSSAPGDSATREIFEKLNQREFPIGHPHYGEKTGRGGFSFMGSIRDGTLDILSYIPEGAPFDEARAYFDEFQALERQYQQHKAEGGDCTKGSPGHEIRTRSQGTIGKLIKSVLEALHGLPDQGDTDELYEAAVELVLTKQRGSTTLLQRAFSIGYNRASRLIEAMEARGLVGEHVGSKRRQVNYTWEEYQAGKELK